MGGEELVSRLNQVVPARTRTFGVGYTAITTEGERDCDVGMDFGIYRMTKGQVISEAHVKESVWVLMHGTVEVSVAGNTTKLSRNSLFDEPPSAVHVALKTEVKITALSDDVEWSLARTTNQQSFDPHVYLPGEVEFEYRGKGLVQNACLRNVRCIFDYHTRPQSNLVIGEVVNFPGRWSSYPPHHHQQPEIYHYRFTLPQGYGHAELGPEVTKVFEGDTVKIKGGEDHSQVSAPGYGMYYLWVVKHLPGNPYKGFEFTEEHKWLLDPKNQGWIPPLGATE